MGLNLTKVNNSGRKDIRLRFVPENQKSLPVTKWRTCTIWSITGTKIVDAVEKQFVHCPTSY